MGSFSRTSPFLVISWLFALLIPSQADVCLILYQMADNDLEWFIRQDNNELIKSSAVRNPALTTWVYFDGRNYGYGEEDIDWPLEDVFNPDGTPLDDKHEGSRYMTWDHSQEKMVVTYTSQGELDGDHPQTLYDFLAVAMSNCVSKNALEMMLIMSSHGGGAAGFGGDEHQRRLTAPNQHILEALKLALKIEGTPDKFEVLGFDACLMQSIGALDEYRTVAKYFLASEAVEPGHGWAYNYLEPSDSALAYATNLHDNFLQQLQGFDQHLTPKTISIVDTDKYTVFLSAWDAFFEELEVQISHDNNIHTITGRAHSSAQAFMGGTDSEDTSSPSAVDVGDFFTTFKEYCVIDNGSELHARMEVVEAAYNDCFVHRGIGEGTSTRATGMHVWWPQRKIYTQDNLKFSLLNETSAWATSDAPKWIKFLTTYYESEAPTDSLNTTACLADFAPTVEGEEGRLLLNPTVSSTATEVRAASQVTATTDEAVVEFGVDLTIFLDLRIRQLKESAVVDHQMSGTSRTRQYLNEGSFASDFEGLKQRVRSGEHAPKDPKFHSRKRRKTTAKGRRRLSTDYFILFGGDLAGGFDGPEYSAVWDQTFLLLGNNESTTQVYSSYAGEGLRDIPVMYFSANYPVTKDDLPFATTIDEAIAIGGAFGFISISKDEAIDGISKNVVLYTFNHETGVFSQTPKQAGGQITPIVFTEFYVDDNLFTEFVGGFDRFILPFDESATDLAVYSVSALEWIEALELDSVVVDINAYDHDDSSENGYDFFSTYVTASELRGEGGPSSSAVTPLSVATFLLLVGGALVVNLVF